MTSRAFQTFEHAIQDADDLLNHFDALNKHPPPPEIEVLKRASLVMALAALETYVEDRIVEAADAVSGRGSEANHLVKFYKSSLENDLKFFHTPSSDRVKAIFVKYLSIDVTEAWTWTHYDPTRVRSDSTRLPKSGVMLLTDPGDLPRANLPHTRLREKIYERVFVSSRISWGN